MATKHDSDESHATAARTKPTHVVDAKGAKVGLTRHGMEQAIREGGSVLYKDEVITSIDALPTDADLAKSEEERAAAAGDLNAQIAALQAQLAKVAPSKPAEKK